MKLKKIRLPHTLVLIYIMVVLTVIATWIVPGGEYDRVEKDGRTIPVADSFSLVERQPQGVGALFISPIKGFIEAAYIRSDHGSFRAGPAKVGEMGEMVSSSSYHLDDIWIAVPHTSGADALGTALN